MSSAMGKDAPPAAGERKKKVVESKKEKKRRLILSDSEDEEEGKDELVLSPRNKAQEGVEENGIAYGNGLAVKKKSFLERLSKEEENGAAEKRVTRSEGVKLKEQVDGETKKKVREPAFDRKRGGEAVGGEIAVKKVKMDGEIAVKKVKMDSEIAVKKAKTDSEFVLKKAKVGSEITVKMGKVDSLENGVKTPERNGAKAGGKKEDSRGNVEGAGKIVKKGFLKYYGDKRPDSMDGRLSGMKPVVNASGQRDDVKEKRSEDKLKNVGRPEDENVRWIERSGKRELRKLRDNSIPVASVKKDDLCISQQNSVRVQGKSGVLKVLRNDKKVGGTEGHIPREEEENAKSLRSTSSVVRSTSKNVSLIKDKKVVEKSSSSVKMSKVRLNTGKVSSAERSKSREMETESDASLPKADPENEALSSSMTDFVAKGEGKFKPKGSKLTKQRREAKVPRSTAKQQVREQIKQVLLNAGWKIDLRPRRGRDYEDSVYIPPEGGGGFWSITKAYAVYQAKLSSSGGDKSGVSGKSSKKSTGSGNSRHGASSKGTVIPMELLSMLKRNVVNKRRRAEVPEELGDRKIKKVKGNIKTRHSSSENSSDNEGAGAASSFTAQRKLHLRVRNKNQRGCALLARGVNQDAESEADNYVPYGWKRTVLSWMIDVGVLPSYGRVKYMNSRKTKTLQEGRITRDGIQCGCCSKILSVSKFEVHAGSKLQQPYENIIVEESGKSLLQCQLNAWLKQEESERQSFYSIDIAGDDPNDDTCGICGDGGDLICCDGCPSTFHLNCMDMEMLPPGNWCCTNCSCKYCGVVAAAAAAQQNGSVFPLQACSLCERKYHEECIPEADAISVGSSNPGTSFCGQGCRKVFRRLQKLIGVKNDLEAGYTWSIIRRFDDESSKSVQNLAQRAECNSKAAVALAVMDECFLPVIDQRSGLNLIHNIVYNCGSNFNRLNYTGFYTFILEQNDEIIAAASIRIHGTRLAEMPFIGTRTMYRRQGMCRRLLNGIESALCSLNVDKLVIPAISELKETWTGVFGFKPLETSEKQEMRSINMLVFPGTGLLQKSVPKNDTAKKWRSADEAGKGEPEINHVHTPESENRSSALSSKNEIKDVELTSPLSDGVIHTTSEVLSGSSRDPHGSKLQAPDDEPSENVYHKDHVGEDYSKTNSINKPKTALPRQSTEHRNPDAKSEGGAVVSDICTVDGTQHCPEDGCASPDVTDTATQAPRTKTAPKLFSVDGALHAIYEVKAEGDAGNPNLLATDEGDEPCTTGNLDVATQSASGKESQASSCSNLIHDADVSDIPISASTISAQQNSEFLQELPECTDADLPPTITNGMARPKSTDETVIEPDSEQNLCDSGEDCVKHHMSDIVDKSSGVDCKDDTSSAYGVKSETSCSSVACSLGTDADKHREHIVADGSPVLGNPDSFASVGGNSFDTPNAELKNAVGPCHHAISESAMCHSADGINGLHDTFDCNGTTSGASGKNIVVQHKLSNANEVAPDVSVESGHACVDETSDASLSGNDSATQTCL